MATYGSFRASFFFHHTRLPRGQETFDAGVREGMRRAQSEADYPPEIWKDPQGDERELKRWNQASDEVRRAMFVSALSRQPSAAASALTVEDVERQYEDGVHIGSGLPRETCPCGFCAKHRHGFNQGDSAAIATAKPEGNEK